MENATVGTHSGSFQADEALGVFLLRQLPQYKNAPLKRSRDLEILKTLTIVIDVAGQYDHELLRYDHHQRGFFETFDGENPTCRQGGRPDVTGPETATGAFKTKLSASGLVYKHYGQEILGILHPHLKDHPGALDWVYKKMYKDFMEEIDGNDNGIEIADKCRYLQLSTLPARVYRMNARWNEPKDGPSEDERFEKASALCGSEFSEMLSYIVEVELPARKIIEEALQGRTKVHASGAVMCLPTGSVPWKTHLYELERELSTEQVKFVLYKDEKGNMWRVQAVTVEGTDFTNRLSLFEPWCGLRDEELSNKAGIPGCKFVHANGFIGGNASYEGALAMAVKTIDESSNGCGGYKA